MLVLVLRPSVAILLVFQILVQLSPRQTAQILLAEINHVRLCILILFCLGFCHGHDSSLFVFLLHSTLRYLPFYPLNLVFHRAEALILIMSNLLFFPLSA